MEDGDSVGGEKGRGIDMIHRRKTASRNHHNDGSTK